MLAMETAALCEGAMWIWQGAFRRTLIGMGALSIFVMSAGAATGYETWRCWRSDNKHLKTWDQFAVSESKFDAPVGSPWVMLRNDEHGIVAVHAPAVNYVWTIIINRKTGSYLNVQMHDTGQPFAEEGKCTLVTPAPK